MHVDNFVLFLETFSIYILLFSQKKIHLLRTIFHILIPCSMLIAQIMLMIYFVKF